MHECGGPGIAGTPAIFQESLMHVECRARLEMVFEVCRLR
jgi:hypothetical protein